MVTTLSGNAKAMNECVASIVWTPRHRVAFCCNKEPVNARAQLKHAASGTFLCVLGYRDHPAPGTASGLSRQHAESSLRSELELTSFTETQN